MGDPRVLLVAIGSAGDVNPLLGLGRVLRGRGRHVTLMTNPYFAPQVEATGLELAPLGTREDFDTVTKDPAVWRGARGTMRVLRYGVIEPMRPVYDYIAERYEPGRTVVAASSLALGARVAHDKLGVPLASVHLQPMVFGSVHETPVLPGVPGVPGAGRWLSGAPRVVKQAAMWGLDAAADRVLGSAVNGLRGELGLPPVRGILSGWWHSPQLVLGMFPDWFASPQPDWPAQTRLVGFPLHDAAGGEELSPAVTRWLDQGEPPIVLTPGSAMRYGRAFFDAGIGACHRLGRRAMLLTRFGEHLPETLPPGAVRFGYVPLSRLLPRCEAVVHHGGIGTMSQGFAAGVPQLLMPMGHDQLDNAARAVRLGAAASLRPARFTAKAVAARLGGLLSSAEAAAACAAAASRCADTEALEQAADAVEGLAP